MAEHEQLAKIHDFCSLGYRGLGFGGLAVWGFRGLGFRGLGFRGSFRVCGFRVLYIYIERGIRVLVLYIGIIV